MKHALPLSLGLAVVVTAAPAIAHDAVGAAIARHEPKSWFTPEQRAFIQAKCGMDVDGRHGTLNIQKSVMTCPNGRVISDPYVKVMSENVSRRANDYVRTVMKQADVQRAIAATARVEARRAIAESRIDARVADAMAHAQVARQARMEARRALARVDIARQIREAMAQAEIGRRSAERARDALRRSDDDVR